MATSTTTNRMDISSVLPKSNPVRLLFSLEPLKAFLFHILSFIVGVTLFVLLITIFATGVSLTLSVIMAVLGIPILALMLAITPLAGHAERFRVETLTGVDIPNPYREIPEGKLGDRIFSFLSDGALWRDLLYVCLLFPIGLVEFVIAITGASVSLSMLFSPVIVALGGDIQISTLIEVNEVIATIPFAGLGFILLIATAYILVIMARAHGLYAQWLIGPNDRDQLAARVQTLSQTRSRMVGVSLDDRRQIERDIHDSTQPKLVSLAMSIGMAREKIDADPERARELLDNAHREAREVLSEIRNLVRGLHPSILTDRGLEAAIRSLAGYCSVPVTVDVELTQRPPDAVETTAYYIVAESLTNVAKHSQATEAHVIVQCDDGMLTINVVDDGVGGAFVTSGSGLAGLQDRAAALDGSLEVSSPKGGPTRITAKLPCELS